MYKIDLNDNPHDFEKQNLVTLAGNYDILKCKKCGIQGKTLSLSEVYVKESYSKTKVDNCIFTEKELRKGNTGKKIKIIKCTAHGRIFENLKQDSEHFIINTPEEQKADTKGVWVMGVGMPVKVLNSEFNYID